MSHGKNKTANLLRSTNQLSYPTHQEWAAIKSESWLQTSKTFYNIEIYCPFMIRRIKTLEHGRDH